MKTIVLGAIILCMVLVAGCTTGQPVSGVPAQSLSMNEPAVLQDGTYKITAMIDHIEADSSKPGKKIVDVYIRATNSGTQPVQLVWYSKITDQAGVSHGGIGVSHGGSGAHAPPLDPGSSAIARDYVVVESDADFTSLSKGGTLDVSFIVQPAEGGSPVNFHTSWVIDPNRIR
ncbi:MAG: hypothetical protein OS112_08955 [Methanoregula sp.]|nr:MAG: hypothetical protein OS112_08955 [Methanoregula sp.]